MRIRIIIDTQDAEDPHVVETDMPFTLNVYKDDEDGTPNSQPLEIGSESCLIGGDIPEMLHNLMDAWSADSVIDQHDRPLPNTSAAWRRYEALEKYPCDECDENPATQFWPRLTPPVQLCYGCTHDARRSGWEPGR